MAAPTVLAIKNVMQPIVHKHFTWQRSVLMGIGLAYAWTESKVWHTPLIVLAPSVYAGYQAFKARDQVRTFISGDVKSHAA